MAYPEAASIQDPNGMLPMHYLACWGPSESSIMDMVLVAYRQAGNARDADGNTPLDLAMEGDYEERDQVVRMLRKWQLSGTSSNNSYASHRRSLSASSYSTAQFVEDDKREDDSFGGGARPTTMMHTMSAPTSGRHTPPASPSSSPSTPFLVGRLKDEISVLKERLKESKWEATASKNMESQASLKQRIASLEKKASRQQDELDLTREELDELQSELEEKEEQLKEKTKKNEELEKKLKEALDERQGLRITLTDLMDQHEKFKNKGGFMNDRLGSLSASLASMMDQHKTVLKAMKDREDAWKKSATSRKEQLKILMSLETEIESDESLEAALDKTHKEMEAISAVVAAARADVADV